MPTWLRSGTQKWGTSYSFSVSDRSRADACSASSGLSEWLPPAFCGWRCLFICRSWKSELRSACAQAAELDGLLQSERRETHFFAGKRIKGSGLKRLRACKSAISRIPAPLMILMTQRVSVVNDVPPSHVCVWESPKMFWESHGMSSPHLAGRWYCPRKISGPPGQPVEWSASGW